MGGGGETDANYWMGDRFMEALYNRDIVNIYNINVNGKYF